MPGFDRTGPRGEGAMTGGGFGLCGSGRSDFYRRPWGAGGGGRGRGMMGRGYRNRFWATGQPLWMRNRYAGYPAPSFPAAMSSEEEIAFLRDNAAALKAKLDAIEGRLAEIESKEKSS